MRGVLCGFALGVAGLQQCAALPSHTTLMLCFLAAMASVLGAWGWPVLQTSVFKAFALRSNAAAIVSRLISAHARTTVAILCAMGIGFGWAGWRAQERLAFYLPPELEQRTLWVEGEVASMPTTGPNSIRFIFDLIPPDARLPSPHFFLTPLPSFFPRRIQLSWYAQPRQAPPIVHVGERLRLKVRLTRIHGVSNPYGTDFEALLLEQNVRARGYVLHQIVSDFDEQVSTVRDGRGAQYTSASLQKKLSNHIAQWRQALHRRLNQVLGDAPHKGVITALAIGLQADISAQDKQIFTRTGTNHLVAISGLHIALAAGFVGNLIAGVWRKLAYFGFRGPLWIATPKVAALVGALTGLVYAALSGFGVPAQRAVIMLCVLSAATLSGREIAASLKLAWALAIVLFIDPWAVVSAGFWLSFGAVAIILLSMRPRNVETALNMPTVSVHDKHGCAGWYRRWLAYRRAVFEMIHLQIAITLGLIPFTALWFSQVSWVGPFANLIAIPWVSFAVVPPVLAGVVLPAPLDAWALYVAQRSFSGLSVVLEMLSAASWALKPLPYPGKISLISAAVGMLLWVERPAKVCCHIKSILPGGRIVLKMVSLGCFIPLFFSFETRLAAGAFRVTALDVGQGAAALIETAHHRLLFDTGPSYHSPWIQKASRGTQKNIQAGPVAPSQVLEASDAGQRIIVPYLRARGIDRLDGLVISHADTDHSGGAHSVLSALPIEWFRASLPKRHPLWSAASLSQTRAPINAQSHLNLPVSSSALCQAGERWVWEGVTFTFLWPDNPKLRGTRNAGSCVLRVENDQYAVLLAADIETPQERQLVAKQREALRADILLAPHHGSRTSSSNAFLYAVAAREVIFQMGYKNRFGHPHPAVAARYTRHGAVQHRSDWHGALIFNSEVGKVERYRSQRPRYWFNPY